jgi:hypothetical protein
MATVIYQEKDFGFEIIRVGNWINQNKKIRFGSEYIRIIAKDNIFDGIRARW